MPAARSGSTYSAAPVRPAAEREFRAEFDARGWVYCGKAGRSNWCSVPQGFARRSLVRVAVGIGGLLVTAFAVPVGRGRVLLRFLVLAEFVVVSRFEVVVGGGLVARGGLVVVVRRRVLLLVGHGCESWWEGWANTGTPGYYPLSQR